MKKLFFGVLPINLMFVLFARCYNGIIAVLVVLTYKIKNF